MPNGDKVIGTPEVIEKEKAKYEAPKKKKTSKDKEE